MSMVIYKGLYLEASPKYKYFYVHPGSSTTLRYDDSGCSLELTYTPSDTNLSISRTLGLKSISEEIKMEEMKKPSRFPDTTITLNGIKFKKLTYDPHIIKIAIVSDQESKVSQSYNHTTIVVSKDDYKNPEFISHLFLSGGLLFIIPDTKKSCFDSWEIRNFPRIVIEDSSLNLTSTSETVYSLRHRYDEYIIRSIDYQDQFIKEIGRILKNYGVEFVRINREKTLEKTSYISYQFNQTPVKVNHPKYSDHHKDILQHKVPVEFELRTTDLLLFHDFKNRYSNVDLLTNFCEYKTTDKRGERWTSAIKWGTITEDFNQTYSSDNNSNFSYQCQFRCELYFYEVFDRSYTFIDEIILDLNEIA